MVDDALDLVRSKIASQFLGRNGIHAVGLSRRDKAVKIYYNAVSPPDRHILDAIEQQAHPFAIQFVAEQPPQAAG